MDAERIEAEKERSSTTFPHDSHGSLNTTADWPKASSGMVFWQGRRSFLFDPIFLPVRSCESFDLFWSGHPKSIMLLGPLCSAFAVRWDRMSLVRR
jgi:hypothetical protein